MRTLNPQYGLNLNGPDLQNCALCHKPVRKSYFKRHTCRQDRRYKRHRTTETEYCDQGPDDVSPDATIPAPSTIAANARASSHNTGETSQKGKGKGRHRSQFWHKQAKHHVARQWPHTEDGSGYIMVTHSLLCILQRVAG